VDTTTDQQAPTAGTASETATPTPTKPPFRRLVVFVGKDAVSA